MNEELTRKLAEWRGFTNIRKGTEGLVGVSPDGNTLVGLHFPQSLDTCFQWLVPKAIDRIMAEHECSSDIAYSILFKWWLRELELNMGEPALTLNLAIGKLIDNEQK